MKFYERTCPFFLFLVIALNSSAPAQNRGVLQLHDDRQLFVDDFLIDKLDNVALRLNTPHNEGSVLKFDKPWEGRFSAYFTIIEDQGLYRAYYRGRPLAGKDGDAGEVTCYAESKDGVTWTKPDLGIHQIGGSKKNNVILSSAMPVTHNFSPLLDKNPRVEPRQKYKALGGLKETGLYAYVSPDGIHWEKMQEEAVFKEGIFDSQNVAFWSESEGQYVCYFRTWTGANYTGFRSVSRTTSPDFIHWTEPVAMTFGQTPYEELYTQQTSPYFRAPQIYIAIGARFMPNRQVVTDEQAKKIGVNPDYYKDCSDAILMSTRGGSSYERKFLESFIRPETGLENWVSRSNYPALNVVQTGPTEMSVYLNEDYAQNSAHLNRYSMRLDGFASLRAPYAGGEVLTKLFTFIGQELEINYSTSAAGEIRVEIQDEKGKPLTGYTLEDSQVIIGNEIKGIVAWRGRESVKSLASRPIRLRIFMKDADLYSLKFN